jgi:hypothetical protein
MATADTDHPVLKQIEFEDKPEGPVSAAILAAGIGALALGIFTTIAEASESIKADVFEWSTRVGALSGKTVLAVVVWLISWAALHLVLRNRPFETRRALTISLILIGIGVVMTFPEFFQAFKSE